MTHEIGSFLDNLSSELEPIKVQAINCFDANSKIQEEGEIQLLKRPWIAPQNFAITLFPPASKEWFEIYKNSHLKLIPKNYIDILLQMNGCFVYDFSLFGLPKSLYTLGILNRNKIQPFDLGTANVNWIKEFNISKNYFYIGSRSYTKYENIGYFIDDKNNVLSIRKNGEVVTIWSKFQDFLAEEIKAAEKNV